jgi:acyl transferase domain-containing protein
MFSAVTGTQDDTAAMDGRYWSGDRGEPARFGDLARLLADSGHGVFIEVSPDPIATAEMSAALRDAGRDAVTVTGTLHHGDGGLRRFLTSLATVHVSGTTARWAAAFTGASPRRADLPTYPFQRQRYWPESTPGSRTASSAVERQFWAAVENRDLTALTSLLGAAAPLGQDTPLSTILTVLSDWHQHDPSQPRQPGDQPQPQHAGQAPAGQAPAGQAPPQASVGADADPANASPADTGPGGTDPDERGASWAQQLAGLDEAGQRQVTLDMVCAETATVLSYDSPEFVDEEADILDLGMSSMSAIELRTALAGLTGLELPEGFIYDLCTPAAIADYLLAERGETDS